jgi:myosin heavy subunit
MFRDFFEPGTRPTMSAIIVNISPSTAQFDDTLFSLQFAAEAVECNVRTDDRSDDDFEIDAGDFEGSGSVDPHAFAETEARIRREIHEEMTERLRKIQSDYQMQVEQIRAQSAQPYATKLQQALAQRMQKDTRSHELEECIRDRDRERARANELESQIQHVQQELNEVKVALDQAMEKNASLEGNIAAMIAATKKLHERHVQLQTDLQNKTAEMEAFWHQRVAFLEGELDRHRAKL